MITGGVRTSTLLRPAEIFWLFGHQVAELFSETNKATDGFLGDLNIGETVWFGGLMKRAKSIT